MVEQNHILDQIPAYALGCLDESEALEAAEHLAVCASCQDELRTYQNLADLLPFGLAQTEPPIQVKQRLIGKIQRAPSFYAGCGSADLVSTINCRPKAQHSCLGISQPGRGGFISGQ